MNDIQIIQAYTPSNKSKVVLINITRDTFGATKGDFIRYFLGSPEADNKYPMM